MAYRVVIWGTGRSYARCLMAIRCQEVLGHIKVVGITSNEADLQQLDGYPFLSKQELPQTDYDFILVALDRQFFPAIVHEAAGLGVEPRHLVQADILNMPGFNFSLYVELRTRQVSIVSINCWGGSVYHCLNLPFQSPFINFFMDAESFARMCRSLPEYLRQPVEYLGMHWNDKLQCAYPLLRLGDVELHANHYQSGAGFIEKWETRLKRLKMDNILVETVAANEKELAYAETIPYRKICFTDFATDAPFAMHLVQKPINESIGFYTVRMSKGECAENAYDPLRLLLGRSDYIRRCS